MTKAASPAASIEGDVIGEEAYALAAEIFPICRSITGDGVRQTLDVLAQHIPIRRHELPTGTPVLDWTEPKEWNIADAYIKNAPASASSTSSRRNLHVVSYSAPVRQTMPIAELKRHVFTLPDQPDLIPYRTSYYKESWGFCMSHRQLRGARGAGEYEVVIDSDLEDGQPDLGRVSASRARPSDEVLISSHICHPSLANDNCSGLALPTCWRRGSRRGRPATATASSSPRARSASITWLAANEDTLDRIKHGLVVCRASATAEAPRTSAAAAAMPRIDRAVAPVLQRSGRAHKWSTSSPMATTSGSTARPASTCRSGCSSAAQFGTLPRVPHVRRQSRLHPARVPGAVVTADHRSHRHPRKRPHLLNLCPKGEPQLGRRGLYPAIGGGKAPRRNMALLWVLNLSDGEHSLLDIAERADFPLT